MNLVALLALLTFAQEGPAVHPKAEVTHALVPSITVVGSDSTTARPDMAEITIGVVTQAPTAGKALKDNNASMDALFKTLAAQGIADKDMQTANLSVQPQYRQNRNGEQQPEIVGYQVVNQLHIKVRKLASLGTILDEVVGQGANQMHGISFGVAENTPHLDAARSKAVADARRKAELYAKAAGVKLGRVLLIQEETARPPIPLMQSFARADKGVPVAPGELEFHASITITYALE